MIAPLQLRFLDLLDTELQAGQHSATLQRSQGRFGMRKMQKNLEGQRSMQVPIPLTSPSLFNLFKSN